MSGVVGTLELEEEELKDFLASLPLFEWRLARDILNYHVVTYANWSFARNVQVIEPDHELINYIANYDADHLGDAYANVMEDVLNDMIMRWRDGLN